MKRVANQIGTLLTHRLNETGGWGGGEIDEDETFPEVDVDRRQTFVFAVETKKAFGIRHTGQAAIERIVSAGEGTAKATTVAAFV